MLCAALALRACSSLPLTLSHVVRFVCLGQRDPVRARAEGAMGASSHHVKTLRDSSVEALLQAGRTLCCAAHGGCACDYDCLCLPPSPTQRYDIGGEGGAAERRRGNGCYTFLSCYSSNVVPLSLISLMFPSFRLCSTARVPFALPTHTLASQRKRRKELHACALRRRRAHPF